MASAFSTVMIKMDLASRGRVVAFAASLFVVSLVSGACVANEPAAPTRGTVVSGPPPAPVSEARPATPPPSPSAEWVNGYWHWTGAQYTWVPGHWETPPVGARWAAPQYTSRDGAYFYEAGRWEHGQPVSNNPNIQHANAIR